MSPLPAWPFWGLDASEHPLQKFGAAHVCLVCNHHDGISSRCAPSGFPVGDGAWADADGFCDLLLFEVAPEVFMKPAP